MPGDNHDYGVRVKRAWDFFRVGQIIFPQGMWRQHLLESGACELVPPPAVSPSPPVSRFVRKAVR